ncbi:PEP/pyruvate-binding domain-containing protein [Piscinibacter terrae]|uniref:Phosphoenolpyruvate synthase n=1 Tax=Piscinibacter terrae TaxID=2496871 RepID=A0A3N7HTE2_9BURK|nr:PEP/pyruvate-binding domain-containing protein [Albitalea terrae]RQP25043.1 pyruvate, phosphate dikinase [Albitalea terrae]
MHRRFHALVLALTPCLAFAQLAEKPSALVARRQGKVVAASSTADKKTPSLQAIRDRRQFDTIARTYNPGTPREITHTLFIVDRMNGNRVHYLNTNRYTLHEDYVRQQYLASALDHKTLASYYSAPNRRFIFGTIGWHAELKRWVYEFWEGDKLTPELLNTARQAVSSSFFAPAVFKANSAQQEAVGSTAGVETITETQILGQRSYLPLNNGSVTGRVRLVADVESDSEDDIEPYDIVVLREVPLAIPPVAGVITERPSTVLSHVNVLAKGWGIPNAYVKDAFSIFQPYDRQWVRLQVSAEGYTVQPAAKPAVPPTKARTGVVRAPHLQVTELQPLSRMRHAASAWCGSKGATLGEVEFQRKGGHLTGTAEVPDGFCVPFAHYAKFMQRDDVRARIHAALATEGFERSRVVRRKALDALRHDLSEMPADEADAAGWIAAWKTQLHGVGVFVRSSSNSEDLPNWSGAGLFSTVPNVTRDADLIKAVQTVWASVFNFEAFEARRHAGIADEQVFMGVFVQRAIDSATSGVMITRDPFDITHRNAVYVSAKRGIGIKVVEGRRIAEQSMFDARSGAVRRLSRSAEDSALQLDANGGVVETAIGAGQDVLSDTAVRSLAKVGQQLKAIFRGVEQDIEWAIDKQGRIVVLQSRPYIERKAL